MTQIQITYLPTGFTFLGKPITDSLEDVKQHIKDVYETISLGTAASYTLRTHDGYRVFQNQHLKDLCFSVHEIELK